MMHSETLPPPINVPLARKQRMFSAYEWFWSFMAALAAVSLATMTFFPDVAAQVIGTKLPIKAAAAPNFGLVNAPAQDVAKAISEVLAARQSSGVLQVDIDKIKAEAGKAAESAPPATGATPVEEAATPAMNEAAKALAATDDVAAREQARAASAERSRSAPVSVVTSVMPPPASTGPDAAKARMGEVDLPATPAPVPTVTGSLPDPVPTAAHEPATAKTKAPEKVAMVATVPDATIPQPTKKPAVVKQAKVETGTIAPATGAPAPATDAPISFGPAVVTKAPEGVGIIIGQGSSIDSIRLHWSVLADQQRELLKGLEPRYVTGSDNTGQVYKLVAGPIKSASDAKKVCKSLEDSGAVCSVGKFTGNAL